MKIALLSTKTPYALHTEHMHGKFPFYFKSSLNSCRDLHSFNFIGTSILMCNRQIDFLSLKKLRFWLFLMLETFIVFLGHIVYNMLFFTILFICPLKFNFESIVILSSVTYEADFMVISRIFNISEPVFLRIINSNLSVRSQYLVRLVSWCWITSGHTIHPLIEPTPFRNSASKVAGLQLHDAT